MSKKLSIVENDFDLLHYPSLEVKHFKKPLRDLAKSMYKTMKKEDGLGISAIQVGEPIRMFVYQTEKMKDPIFAVNPEIVEYSDTKVKDTEGCLSLPGIKKDVERSTQIDVKYLNTFGHPVVATLQGLEARVFQHEFDHLNGILITDK